MSTAATPAAPQPWARVRAPAAAPKKKPAARTMMFGASSWQPQVRGLNQDGQAQARTNWKRRLDESGYTPEQQAAAQTARARPPPAAAASPGSSPPMQTPAPKRPHRATRPTFMYLPAGFTVGTEHIGSVRREGEEGQVPVGTRPKQNVLIPPAPDGSCGRTRIYDDLKGTTMPSGEKCNKPSKTWVVSQQLYAEEYSRVHGYTKPDGAHRMPRPQSCPRRNRPPQQPATSQAKKTRMRSSTTR